MILLLTKRKKNGDPYERSPSVTAAIGRATTLPLETFLDEVRNDDSGHSGFVEPECIVHMLRASRLDNTDSRFLQLLELLLTRIERSMKGSIRPSRRYNAEELRSEVVEQFVELLLEDRNAAGTRLDYFEVRFASALAALRIDVMRASERLDRGVEPIEEMYDGGGEELPALTDQIRQAFEINGSEQEREHFRNELHRAIDDLPDHEKVAVTLVLEGHPIEGEGAETVAKLCGVGDRAIRYRLTKAYEKLRRKLGERR